MKLGLVQDDGTINKVVIPAKAGICWVWRWFKEVLNQVQDDGGVVQGDGGVVQDDGT
jgi:hypothetical protein